MLKQRHASRQDGVEAARLEQFAERPIAERIGESSIGVDQHAAFENADGFGHRFEQACHAVRRERGRSGADLVVLLLGRAVLPQRARPEQHTAFERARDVLERFAVSVQLLDAPLWSKLGHAAPNERRKSRSGAVRHEIWPRQGEHPSGYRVLARFIH
jgi:hypothetical protein